MATINTKCKQSQQSIFDVGDSDDFVDDAIAASATRWR